MSVIPGDLSRIFNQTLVISPLDDFSCDELTTKTAHHLPCLPVALSPAPASSLQPATIHALPVELLDIIFKIAHSDWLLYTLHPELYSSQPNALPSRTWKSLMKLFCQFPYTPAAVCRHWREIILCTPCFWTRPVVFVDTRDPLSTLAILRSFLERSRDLSIVVAVVRRSYCVKYDIDEALNLSLIMGTLSTNLHRFHDMYFHVNRSSSLPSIASFVWKPPTNLLRLALHCDVDDGPSSENYSYFSAPIDHTFSSLITLKLDGRNFLMLCKHPSIWTTGLAKLKFLTVERLKHSETYSEASSLLPALQMLAGLPALDALTFRDVAFQTSPREPGTAHVAFNVSDLMLEDLSDEVVRGLFDLTNISPTYLLIRNVPIDELPHVPQPLYLELVDISTDQDLEDFLCFWDGEVLAVRRCPGFDDNLLGMFEVEISPPYHISPSLRELHIQDCPNFTAGGLRRMVEMRLDFATRPENVELGLVYITEIYVCGTGPILSAEDMQWFRANLKTFTWSTVQLSGGSCHLDDSSAPFTIL